LSSSTVAVADTIGAFAESQVVADAVTNIVNKREVEIARVLTATQGVSDQTATAFGFVLKIMTNVPFAWSGVRGLKLIGICFWAGRG
jgi:hypothetical protein